MTSVHSATRLLVTTYLDPVTHRSTIPYIVLPIVIFDAALAPSRTTVLHNIGALVPDLGRSSTPTTRSSLRHPTTGTIRSSVSEASRLTHTS